jgi:glycosyltransferase involved in cell wall biosynthesis
MPRVTIITPTKDRQPLLPAIWNCVRAQSDRDFEWLVHDGSSQSAESMFKSFNDPRVHYVHEPKQMRIGARRNALCEAAKGDIIAQFDDDDYYAPQYIKRMLSFMNERDADFVELFGFFLYCRGSDTFAYWDLEYDLPIHFRLMPNAPLDVYQYRGGGDAQWGYGFSYVFYRRVWEAIPFPDRDHGEDHEFASAVIKRFKSAGMQDRDHLCVHVLHTNNASIAFPQRTLRRTQLAELFPGFS